MGAGVDMHAKGDRHTGGGAAAGGDLADEEELVEIVDLDHRSLRDGALEDGAAFKRTVEDDVGAGDAIAPGLFVFEGGDDLGDGAFLVKDAADGVEVVRFVGPRELHIRVAAVESALCLAVFFAEGGFGEDEQRAAVAGHERETETPSISGQQGVEPKRKGLHLGANRCGGWWVGRMRFSWLIFEMRD